MFGKELFTYRLFLVSVSKNILLFKVFLFKQINRLVFILEETKTI